jgi:hypothetical protein
MLTLIAASPRQPVDGQLVAYKTRTFGPALWTKSKGAGTRPPSGEMPI